MAVSFFSVSKMIELGFQTSLNRTWNHYWLKACPVFALYIWQGAILVPMVCVHQISFLPPVPSCTVGVYKLCTPLMMPTFCYKPAPKKQNNHSQTLLFRMTAILLIFKGAKAQHGQHFLKISTTEEDVQITFQQHKVVPRRNGCSSVAPTQSAQRRAQLRLQSHME